MKKFILSFTAVSSLFLASCATIVSKKHYPVRFTSTQSGVQVKITDTETNLVVHKANAPTSASLKAGNSFRAKTYKVEAIKGRKVIAATELTSSISGWYFANIVSWGLAGFVIDAANGKMYALPREYNVAYQNNLKIIDYKSLTPDQRAQLVEIK